MKSILVFSIGVVVGLVICNKINDAVATARPDAA